MAKLDNSQSIQSFHGFIDKLQPHAEVWRGKACFPTTKVNMDGFNSNNSVDKP